MDELDLSEHDPVDGREVLALVEQIRSMARGGPVRVRGCPQMVAHTLYKVGDLRDGRITLVDVRFEEPYG